jgi:Putative addiction module component
VTIKEELHLLIDGLSDEQARDLLEDLRDAADTDGPPLDEEALASLDRGLADIAADPVITVEDFEREPPVYEWQIQELERRRLNLLANPESVTDWESVKRRVRGLNRL